MKKLAVLTTLLAILLVSLFVSAPAKGPVKLISPLGREEKVLGVNQWFPGNTADVALTNAPALNAQATLFVDIKTGQVLFSKNPHQKLPIASLVKVMTALIALEYKSMDDEFLVSRYAAEAEPDKMLLIAGEKLTLRELLDGIFLISANDAAEVIAEDTTGGRDEFIKLMNDKAKQLGMKESYFANPSGLDEDSNNSYSTVYDLAILTRYLIRRYPEVVGFKTGYTPEAGLTLITLVRKNGHEVVGVLLGSGDRRDEAREILDYSFSQLK